MAKSKLRDPERLNHLLLACAVVTLWVHQIGQEVWQQKQRKQIDPAAGRHLSIFQLGWRTLQRAVSGGEVPALTLCIRPMRLKPGVFVRKYIFCKPRGRRDIGPPGIYSSLTEMRSTARARS